MPYLLLSLSIALSAGRNLLSKNLSKAPFGTKLFFNRQSILFLFGALALIAFGNIRSFIPSSEIIIYSIIYACLLVFAQWFYTIALGGGNTGLCSTVYSLGFILPTLSGAIFWDEPFSFLDGIGILCAVFAILLSRGKSESKERGAGRYFIPLIVAMLASGGLGIMQKVQQKSESADEKSLFLLLAFLLAAAFSFAFSLFSSKGENSSLGKSTLSAIGVGLAFGSCNLLNTALAGLLPSALFFPTLNIGVILLTIICGTLIYKEKIGRRDLSVLLFGALSILLLNIT